MPQDPSPAMQYFMGCQRQHTAWIMKNKIIAKAAVLLQLLSPDARLLPRLTSTGPTALPLRDNTEVVQRQWG